MTSPHEDSGTPSNGAMVPAVAPCPLDEHLKEHLRVIEFRLAQLEIHRDRLEHALREAGRFIFDSPMSKMMLASIPKEKQAKLKEFFNVGSTTK